MQGKFRSNAPITKPVSVVTDSGTRINRLDLTRELCDLESFVKSPTCSSKSAHMSHDFSETGIAAQSAQAVYPARKIDFSEKGFLTAEYPDTEPEPRIAARTPRENRTRMFDPTPETVVAPRFSFEDRVSMARLLETEASAVSLGSGEASKLSARPTPKPANPFFDTRAERRPMPAWMWTLFSFGGCGTACGAVIFAQSMVGMPISAGILNLGLSVFVSGCAMFALAGGLAFTRKDKLAY